LFYFKNEPQIYVFINIKRKNTKIIIESFFAELLLKKSIFEEK